MKLGQSRSILANTLQDNINYVSGISLIQNEYLQQFFADEVKRNTRISNENQRYSLNEKQNRYSPKISTTKQNLFLSNCQYSLDPKTQQMQGQNIEKLEHHFNQAQQPRKQETILCNKICIPKSQKVTNVPKFLLKCLITNYLSIFRKYLTSVQDIKHVKNFLNRIKRKQKISSMLILSKFAHIRLQNSDIDSKEMRKMMAEIIKFSEKEQVLGNKRVRQKKLYLIATKVYRWRCRSSALVHRSTFR